ASSFDIRTIALHELGHTLGLADLYDISNTDQIMYGYNDGTSRWTLGSGDIAGIRKLYGAPTTP
ncbi:matrixin family metalloprotease, partial [Methanothrix sp.]|uniref:matrixin family metalloprotease n=1 Tax=Methanothrix sp. TaxID=90426 RepID=UPI0034E24FEF